MSSTEDPGGILTARDSARTRTRLLKTALPCASFKSDRAGELCVLVSSDYPLWATSQLFKPNSNVPFSICANPMFFNISFSFTTGIRG